MTDDHAASLAAIESRWMTGGSAVDVAPPAWADAAGPDPAERELRLLALAGQSAQVMFRPKAPDATTSRPPLPMPGLPILPDRARIAFKTAMKQAGSHMDEGHVLALLEARGYAAHPFDWMPNPRNAHLPDAYLPLAQWVAKGEAVTDADAALTADSWDEFFPAARQSALSAMRLSEPETVLSLLEQKFGGETAEIRTSLMAVFAINPSPVDIPFLQTLASDRSGKVQAAARRFLARLGGHSIAPSTTDLAHYVEAKTSGILKRSRSIAPVKLKTAAQIESRRAFFADMTLEALAAALEYDERSFLDAWQWQKDADCDALIVELAAHTAGDRVIDALVTRLFGQKTTDPVLVALLADRMKDDDIRQWHRLLIQAEPLQTRTALDQGLRLYGWMPADLLLRSRLLGDTRSALAADNTRSQTWIASSLDLLGLLADRHAATALLEALRQDGLGIGARETALLRLNSLLEPNPDSPPETDP
ncbi:DUF5691 domain-containing protein [Oricola sp.]|uniref:DUF5691 domain-containing protein n=1 Tax=Oricola sp. TaxID=1979950 RepID=UPI0025F4C68F|nr:DUF5691 domain-containing protein [Oricola sp.]MCI5075045.1 DUF5691 domain-containing protein [Oricola sp.]